MLSDEVTAKLNSQINLEFYSSNLYLQMSSWCAGNGLNGCASFLRAHAAEEMTHMHRIFDYINDCGAMAVLGVIEAPPTEFKDVAAVFRQTYEHECSITRSINLLVHASFEAKDFSTFNFLQWYVAEQHEEEKLFKNILDKIKIIGTHDRSLYHFDREMAAMAAAPPA